MRVRRSKCPLLLYQGEDQYREERQRHARDRRTKEGGREGCGKDGTAKPRETKEPSRARNKSEMGANGLTSLSFSLIYWRHRCEFGIPRGAVVSETIVLKCVSGLLFKTKRTTSLASTLGKVSVFNSTNASRSAWLLVHRLVGWLLLSVCKLVCCIVGGET